MLNFTEIFWTTWSKGGSAHVIDLIRSVIRRTTLGLRKLDHCSKQWKDRKQKSWDQASC